jgi:hypothetical protein
MFGRNIKPGGSKERSRHAVQGERRLPKHFLLGLDAIVDSTAMPKLESLALRLWSDKAAFEYRQVRRQESRQMQRARVSA